MDSQTSRKYHNKTCDHGESLLISRRHSGSFIPSGKIRGFLRSRSRSIDEVVVDGLSSYSTADTSENAVICKSEEPQRIVHTYIVKPSDTLLGIAAKFDTIPSDLSTLNKLPSHLIFPGQILIVPSTKNQDIDNTDSRSHLEFTSFSTNDKMDQECIQKFLKINVRHITDGQGVVNGVLLVTPNAVMFDPNVSDPLVIEHGSEAYGVIAPLEYVINSAIFYDIVYMRVKDWDQFNSEHGIKQVDIYKGEFEKSSEKQENLSMLDSQNLRKQYLSENKQSITETSNFMKDDVSQDKESSNAFENELSNLDILNKGFMNSQSEIKSSKHNVNKITLQPLAVLQQKNELMTKRQRMLKHLSQPLHWVESLSESVKEPTSAPPNIDQSGNSVFKVLASTPRNLMEFSSNLFSRSNDEDGMSSTLSWTMDAISKAGSFVPNVISSSFHSSSHDKDISNEQSQISSDILHNSSQKNFKSAITMDDVPNLFTSIDKLIVKSTKQCEESSLYLRLKMGKPINKRIPHRTPLMSYGKKRMRSEYWFSIPRDKVNNLYKFLLIWAPHTYGQFDENEIKARGYELVDSDTDLWDMKDDENDKSKRNESAEEFENVWEKLSLNTEIHRVVSSMPSLDYEISPELLGHTEILQEDQRRLLAKNFAMRIHVFSTSQHGFSLNSLYRKMRNIESCVLLVVQDTHDKIFGAFLSCGIIVCDSFYGTGECFLYTFYPKFLTYKWTGENEYFIKGSLESLIIGASEGHFGLFLDSDLYQGRTEFCQTFKNEPLTCCQDFIITAVECWCFE